MRMMLDYTFAKEWPDATFFKISPNRWDSAPSPGPRRPPSKAVKAASRAKGRAARLARRKGR